MGPRLRFLLVSTTAAASVWLLQSCWNKDADSVQMSSQRAASCRVSGSNEGPKVSSFDWNSVVPTADLTWHPCYESFQCARLEVPLDYSEPEERKAAIALIRQPALIPRHSPVYKGPILLNPGGPGGSGVDLIRLLGPAFATILGPQFDIVSFDPRGIARSTPRASFFDTDGERMLFRVPLPVLKNSTRAEQLALPRAQALLLGTLAVEHDDGYLRHINTANTATDMLSIVQAHGRDKLQFWGFSYGTLLGVTFASMYPDSVERIVIDGVVDAEDYYSTNWLTSLVDAEKTLDIFFEKCVDAGPIQCPFYAPEPADIHSNLTMLYTKLRKDPIPVRTKTSYGIVDESLLRQAVFVSLYSPEVSWLSLAIALKRLSAGDGSMIMSMAQTKPISCPCDSDENGASENVWDSLVTVVCNDGDAVSSSSSELEKYFEKLAKVSDWTDIWGAIHLGCIGWPKTKKYFRGPFVANTSHPILLIGNVADPVTPLRSAKKMAQGFKGSVVLTQNSPGHCSLNNPSLCTQYHIRKYFQDGTLPEPNTVCQPIIKNPFIGRPSPFIQGGAEQAQFGVQEEDKELWNAVSEISEKFKPAFLPLANTF